jgi:2-polyprenyl-3-methyl-5-hydroxy-6-metoxy-1,4-benzoquinol methylase
MSSPGQLANTMDPCPGCGGTTIAVRLPLYDEHGRTLPGEALVCDGCGIARTRYTVDIRSLEREYANTYYSYSMEGYDPSRLRLKRAFHSYIPLTIRRTIARRWLTMLPPRRTGVVLDVGCGAGASLDIWKSLGWNTYGLEIDQGAIDACRIKGHAVYRAGSPEGQFSEAMFDWITMDNVLEHLDDPRATLRALRPLLKPDGVLTICVPNFGACDAALLAPYWAALDFPHHRFHFTTKGLRPLLEACGFAITDLAYQPRFVAKSLLVHAGRRESGPEFEGLARRVKRLHFRKLAALALAPKISEEDGFFITLDARRTAAG